jgi:predicted phage tail protein
VAEDPMRERDRERRFERRTRPRIVVAGAVGVVVGAILGAIVGAIVFDVGTAAFWAMVLAGAILVGGIAMVQGGMAALGSTDPGQEPADAADPLRAERGLTSTEPETPAWTEEEPRDQRDRDQPSG